MFLLPVSGAFRAVLLYRRFGKKKVPTFAKALLEKAALQHQLSYCKKIYTYFAGYVTAESELGKSYNYFRIF